MRQPTKFGKYLLLERIAVGGMAEVFVAKAFGVEGFERLLAIKKILPTMGEDAEFITMFVDEARIAVQLSHANIVQVLELGKHDENLYIAMEYISGRDLRQMIEGFRKRQQAIPVPQACLIVAEVCEALDYAHRKRDASGRPLCIVHRDVSPQNVLVSFDGEVKLIDFGIAKAESRLQKTQAGILKGKFSYMSPEQVKGQPIDGRSDIFACGILLWELLSGEKLFTGESDFAILEKVRNGVVPPPRNCPEDLQKVIFHALAGDPAQRYLTASELHDELSRFTLTGDLVYGSRQLADWLREEFKADWDREQQRLRSWLDAGHDEVTPADAALGRSAPSMVSMSLAITPRDPFPGPALLSAIEAASSEPTQQFRVLPDQDTLALPPEDAHELPTMKMDGEALAQAERAFDSGPAATPSRSLTPVPIALRSPRIKKRPRWPLYAGGGAIALVLSAGILLEIPDEVRRGKLVVTRTPPVEAELMLDGRNAGALPFVRTVAAGAHRIEVRADGYKPFAAEVEVPAGGKPVELDAQLVQDPPAPMQMDDVVLSGPAEPARRKKPSAPHHAAQPDQLSENVVPVPIAAATPVAVPAVGYLTASSRPAARLTIDGRDTTRWTPVPAANPIALPAGAHTIVFETADGRRLEEQVEIEAGKTAKLSRALP